MKITKSQLQRIIKEELLKEAGGSPGRQFGRTMGDLDADAKTRETNFLSIPGKEATLDFLRDELGSWQPSALARLSDVLQTERFDLTEDILGIIDGALEQDSPRYETSAEQDLAKFQQNRFAGREE